MSAARTGYSAGLLLLVCVGLSSSLQLTDDWIISQFKQLADRDVALDGQVRQQEATIKQQDSVINSLKEQVQQQQMTLSQLQQDSQQQATLAQQNQVKLETEVSQLREQLSKSQQDMQQQAANFYQTQAQLLTQVHDLKQKMSRKLGKHVTKVGGKGQGMVSMETDVEAPENTLTSGHGVGKKQESLFRPSRQLENGQTTSAADHVAFHAVIGKKQNINIGDVVKFETVLLNVGYAYHPMQGRFYAPVDGLYIFSLSISISPTNGEAHIDTTLMWNSKVLGGTYSQNDTLHRDQGSVTVIVQLKKDDEIWVKIQWGNGLQIYNENYSSLTGALLFQL